MSKEIIAQKFCIGKFLRIVHPTNGRICLVIINRDTDEVTERYTTPSRVHKLISFLRFCNANGCDIYFTPSELKPNRKRKRTKSNFLDKQKIVFIEFDQLQHSALDNIRIADYPPPSAVVASSKGRHHVYWRLKTPICKHRQEELMSNIARHVGGDTVSTDTSRLLRLPTFCNKKPSRENFRSTLMWPPDDKVKIEPASVARLRDAVDDYQEYETLAIHDDSFHTVESTSISSGVSRANCASSKSSDTSQSGKDWHHVNDMLFAKGQDPDEVIRWLESQSGRKSNPYWYARRTVTKALIYKDDPRYKDLNRDEMTRKCSLRSS